MAFLLKTGRFYSSKLVQSIRRPAEESRHPFSRQYASSQAQAAYEKRSAGMGKKRKFASVERVAEADAFYCPACTQKSLKWPVFSRHLQRCCPDLLSGKAILTNESLEQPLQHGSDIKKALQSVVEEEEARRQQLVRPITSIKQSSWLPHHFCPLGPRAS